MKRQNFIAAVTVLAMGCSLGLNTAYAQAKTEAFPVRPITIVVPFDAGGSTDIVARMLAQEMGKDLGQSVVVENRPGATGRIGAEYVLRQAADGYTLVMMTITTAMNAAMGSGTHMDVAARFTGAASLATTPLLLVINPAVPAVSLAELVALGKKESALNFGSSGNAGMLHLAGERFKLAAGLSTMHHVPYKGSTPSLNDLMGGQIQMMFESMPSAYKLVKSGKLRALAVTSATRSPGAPEIPTMAEQGFPAFEIESWFGLMAPAGTPDAALSRIDSAAVRALANPDVLSRLAQMGLYPKPMKRTDISPYVAREVEGWKNTVSAAQIKIE